MCECAYVHSPMQVDHVEDGDITTHIGQQKNAKEGGASPTWLRQIRRASKFTPQKPIAFFPRRKASVREGVNITPRLLLQRSEGAVAGSRGTLLGSTPCSAVVPPGAVRTADRLPHEVR